MPTITPAEQLPDGDGRVQQQTAEFDLVTRTNRSAPYFSGFTSLEQETFFQQIVQDEGWSGDANDYINGDSEFFVWAGDDQLFVGAASRGSEVSLKSLNVQQREQFAKSDKVEWQSITGTKAVKVHDPEAAKRLRLRYPPIGEPKPFIFFTKSVIMMVSGGGGR